MTAWKKLIYSGSDAHLNNLSASNATIAGKVGIGTATPSTMLHISQSNPNDATAIRIETDDDATHGGPQLYIEGNKDGASNILATAIELKRNDDARAAGIKITEANHTDEWFIGASYNDKGFTIGFDASNNNHSVRPESSSLMIAKSGNVGIGTSSPSRKLHVETSGQDGALKLYQDTYQQFDFKYDETFHSTMMFGHYGELQYDGNGGYLRLSNTSNQVGSHIAFATSGSRERMRITHDGKVGIGTTTPGTINGYAFSGVGLHTKFGTLGRTITEGTSFAEFIMNHSGTTADSRVKFIMSRDENLKLGSMDDDGTRRTQLTINNTGDVGIGTETPSATLEVNGNVKATSFTGSLQGTASHALVADTALNVEASMWYNGNTYITASTDVQITGSLLVSGTLNTTEDATIGGNLSVEGGSIFGLNGFGITLDQVSVLSGSTNFGSGSNPAQTNHRFTGSVFITGSKLIMDGGKVGIGTDSPNQKLDVQDGYIRVGKPGAAQFQLVPHASNDGYGFYDVNNLNYDMWFYQGKVGIGTGTVTPSGPLHVKGSTNDTVVYIDTDDNAIGDSAKISFNGSRAQIGWIDSAVTLTDGGGNKDIKLKVDNASILLQTSDTTRMFVSASGKVGIGTTSPATKLDVNGIATSLGFQTDTANTNYNLISRNNTSNPALYVQKAGNTANEPIADFRYANAAAGQGTSVLKVARGTSSFNNTTLGIGTITPFHPLHVNGNARVQGQLMVGDSNADNNPTAPLHIKNSGAAFLRIEDKDGNNSIYDISVNSGSGFSILEDSNTRLFIEEGGNVGIGTDTPGYKLDVTGDSTSGVIAVRNSANGRDTFRSENAGGTRTVNIGNDSNGHGIVLVRGSGGTTTNYIAGNGDSYFNAGNVGIGITSPNDKLEVAGNVVLGKGMNRSVRYNSTNGSFRITPGLTGGWASGYFFNNQSEDLIGGFGGFGGESDSFSYFWIGDDYNDTTMVIQGNAGNVGIGTTSPNQKLTVKGNISASGDLYVHHAYVSGTLSIEGFPNVSASLAAAVSQDAAETAATASTITVNTVSEIENEFYHLVLADTASAGEQLHVHNKLQWNPNTTNLQITGDSPIIKIENTDETEAGIHFTDKQADLYQYAKIMYNSDGVSNIDAGNSLKFYVGSTTPAITISGSSKVGIGTVDPLTELDLVGTASFGDTTDGLMIYRRGNVGYIEGVDKDRTGFNAIQIAANGSTTSPNLHLDTSGQVGIGTISPTYKLDVETADDIVASFVSTDNKAAIQIRDNDTVGYVSAENDLLSLGANPGVNADHLNINVNTNKVGIGTNAPSYKLHIFDSGSDDFQLQIFQTGSEEDPGRGSAGIRLESRNNYNQVGFIKINDTGLNIGTTDNENIIFQTNGTERARIMRDTGRVGIGTTAPATTLHLKNSAAETALKIESANTDPASIYLANSDGSFRIVNDGNMLDFLDDDTDTSRLHIDASGNVGIGTTSPAHELDVRGNIQISSSLATLYLSSSGTGHTHGRVIIDSTNTTRGGGVYWRDTVNTKQWFSGVGYNNNGKTWHVGYHSGSEGSGDANAAATPSAILTVEADRDEIGVGKVGIGTISPGSVFEVYGGGSGDDDVDRYARFKASNGEKRFDFYIGGTGNASRLSMFDSDGTTEGARIYSAGISWLNGGNVGIGTSSPNEKLEVVGNISASGTISASALRIENDAQIDGDLGIGGNIFGLSGFGVTIDDVAVTSGSVNFGSGSNPGTTEHSFTGSMSITGSTFTFNGESVLTSGDIQPQWFETSSELTSSVDVGISGSLHVQGDITASSLSIVPAGLEVIEFAASASTVDGAFATFGLLNFAGSNGFIGHKNNVNALSGITNNGIQFNANDNSLILGGASFINIKNAQDTAGTSIQFKAYHDVQFGTNEADNIMFMTQSHVEINSARITGSLFGTAQTASYVETAQTASYVETTQTASYVETAQTASYVTASNIDNFATDVSRSAAASGFGDGSGNSLWYNASTELTSSVDVGISGSLTITNPDAAQLILRGDTGNVGDGGVVDGIIEFQHDDTTYGYRINTENYGGKSALNIQEKIDGSYTSRLYINQLGNIGIGTSSPTSKLHVNGIVTASAVNIKNGTYNQFLNLDRTSEAAIDQIVKLSPSSAGSGNTALNITIGTGQFQFTEAGRVGIGTTSPSAELEVNGDIQADTLTLDNNLSVAGEVTAPLTFNSSANIISSASRNDFRNTVSSTKFIAYKDTELLAAQNAGGGSIIIDPSDIGSGYPITIKGDDVGLKIFPASSTNKEIHLGRYGGGAAADNLTGSLIIKKDGDLRLHTYGSGTHTGTLAKTLGVDSSGNVIEFDSISGADAATLDGIDSTSFLRSDEEDSASERITFTKGINVGDFTNGGIFGSNYNISGVNQLTINDPGEGIVFTGTTTVTLAAIDDATDSIMNFANASELRVNNSKVWTAANDGAGSTLDADTVDTLHASSFLRSDDTDTATGDLTFTGFCTFDNDASPSVKIVSDDFAEGLQIHRNHSTNAPGIKFTNNAGQKGILYADNSGILRWRDGSSSNTYKIWHEGNDGPSSGLDADTLDGNEASAFLTSIAANSIGNAELEYSTGQSLTTASNPTFNNLYIAAGIHHSGDTNTKIIFPDTEDQIDFYTGGNHKIRITTTGVQIGTSGNLPNDPINVLDIRHDATDMEDGIMIAVDEADTGDLLGGIGFDSEDGNVPSRIYQASAYIAAYAGENHGNNNKGGYLTFGVSEQGTSDDTNSTEVVRIAMDKRVHFKDDIIAFSSTVSDERLKTDIQLLTGSLDTICNLEGVRYNWKYRDAGPQLGVIAQQVEPHVPEIIKETELPLHAAEETDTTKYKTVQYEQLVPHLIEAIKELKAEVDELKSRLTDAE